MNKMKLIKVGLVIVVVVLSGLSFYFFADNDSEVLFADMQAEEKPLRLHVLANSDSTADQQLKLQVRDYIISLVEPELSVATDKQEAMQWIEDSLPTLSTACNDYLAGCSDYTAQLTLARSDFPDINYDGVIFAAGEYDALKIVVGEGAGKNWWCVLFPPLCFVDLATEYESDDSLAVWAPADESSNSSMNVQWKLSGLFRK